MPLSITGMQCCGIKEIGGLRNVRNTPGSFDGFERELRTFISTYNNGTVSNAYFIFSAVVASGVPLYGEEFKAFILKNNLGEVQETTVNRNPNSGNQLRVYLWTINQSKLKDWYAQGAPTKAAKVPAVDPLAAPAPSTYVVSIGGGVGVPIPTRRLRPVRVPRTLTSTPTPPPPFDQD